MLNSTVQHVSCFDETSEVTPSPLEGEGWDGGSHLLRLGPPTSILPRMGGGGENFLQCCTLELRVKVLCLSAREIRNVLETW